MAHNGKRVEFKGIYSQEGLKIMYTYWVKQLLKKGKTFWANLFTISPIEGQKKGEIPAEINITIHQTGDVFAQPSSLPPRGITTITFP